MRQRRRRRACSTLVAAHVHNHRWAPTGRPIEDVQYLETVGHDPVVELGEVGGGGKMVEDADEQ